jgi:hypothetical protein
MSTPSEQTREFITALWGENPDQWLLFWTLPSRVSYWTRTITDELIAQLQELAKTEDVYIGCGASGHDYGPTLRCPANEITAIPGLWLDIDVKGETHKKQNLPPTYADAKQLLAEMGPPPSLVVNSGHGIHAWWLFKEPWVFESDEDRQRAATLSMAWSRTLKHRAKLRGWDADITGDLARVMRLPGVWNRKGDPRFPVRTSIMDALAGRYEPDDLQPLVLPDEKVTEKGPNLAWAFILRPDANPPPQKFMILSQIDPKFLLSYKHQRPDLQDNSASSMDLALATRAMMVGWTAQEIVDLLIAHRRDNKEDLKLRKDYYDKTLNAALQSKGMEERTETAEALLRGEPVAPDKRDHASMLLAISSTIDLDVVKILKYLSDPPAYEMWLRDGRSLSLGGIDNLAEWRLFRNQIGKVANHPIKRMKPPEWDKVYALIMAALEEIPVGEQATERGSLRYWIEQYLSPERIHDETNWKEAALNDQPFHYEGGVWFTMEGFCSFVQAFYGERFTAKRLAGRCGEIGCKDVAKGIRYKGRVRKKHVWLAPETFLADVLLADA